MSKLEKIEKYVAGHKEEKLVKLAQDKDQEVRLAAIAGLSLAATAAASGAATARVTAVKPCEVMRYE